MKKICVFCEIWESGGIEAFVSNVLLSMDRTGMEIDIIVTQRRESFLTAKLEAAGIRLIELSGHLYHLSENYRLFRELLGETPYDVIHLNAFHGMSLYYLKIAADRGVPVRIAHSHNTALRSSWLRPGKELLHRRYAARYAPYATALWACSRSAGEFLFPAAARRAATVSFIPNGISIDRFIRDPAQRQRTRSALGIGASQLLLGNVGRLCCQKNQSFLLDILAAVKRRRPDAALLLVGEGTDRAMLERKAAGLGLQDSVRFYGTSAHVERLLWAMDVFVFPSLFEGFGIAVLEAQAAGLAVVCSDRVPAEARVVSTAVALPLERGAEEWARQILAVERDPAGQPEIIRAAGFDMADVSARIESYYRGVFSDDST